MFEETVTVDGVKMLILVHQGNVVPENVIIKPTLFNYQYVFSHPHFNGLIIAKEDSIMEVTYD